MADWSRCTAADSSTISGFTIIEELVAPLLPFADTATAKAAVRAFNGEGWRPIGYDVRLTNDHFIGFKRC